MTMTDEERLDRLDYACRKLLAALIWEIDNFACFGSGAKTKHELEQLLQMLDLSGKDH